MKRFILLLVLFTFVYLFPNTYAQEPEPNLTVHVSLVTTHPDATYDITDAFGAKVIITNIDTYKEYSGYTDENGVVQFYINETGMFNIDIQYMNTTFKPHTFYFDKNYKNRLNEYVFKLAKFFAGDQITIFKSMWISLPGSVTFFFPESTSVNVTVESYGLRWQTTKNKTQCVFTPLDYSMPVYDASGRLVLYPNYTVTIEFKTLEAGYISRLVIDNATIKDYGDPLFYVPADVWVKIKFVLFVKKLPYEKLVSDIKKDLEEIKILLEELKDLIIRHNQTIYTNLDLTRKSLGEGIDLIRKGFGNFTLDNLWNKLLDIYGDVSSVKLKLEVLSTQLKSEIKSEIGMIISDRINQILIATGVIVIIGAVVIGYSGYKAKMMGKKKSEEGFIVVE